MIRSVYTNLILQLSFFADGYDDMVVVHSNDVWSYPTHQLVFQKYTGCLWGSNKCS